MRHREDEEEACRYFWRGACPDCLKDDCEVWIGQGRCLSYVVCGMRGTPNWHIVKAFTALATARDYLKADDRVTHR